MTTDSKESLNGASSKAPPTRNIGIISYRFLTTETNLKALYIFRCLVTTSSVKLFVVNIGLWCLLSTLLYWWFKVVYWSSREFNVHFTLNFMTKTSQEGLICIKDTR